MEKNNVCILNCLVIDKPGVLVEVAGVIRRRGFNITSLAVGYSESPGLSRMTITVEAKDLPARIQIRNQIKKVIDVIEVEDVTKEDIVSRELALIKVKVESATRGEIIQIVDIFRADIIDIGPQSLTIEVTAGNEGKIEALLSLLKDFGVVEVRRSGRLTTLRGLQ